MSYEGEGGLADIKTRLYRSRGAVILGADGSATIEFPNGTPTAATNHIQLTAWVGADEAPILVNPVSWIESNGQRTGVVIQGARMRSLPTSIAVLTALFGFRVWLSTDVQGVTVDWMLY